MFGRVPAGFLVFSWRSKARLCFLSFRLFWSKNYYNRISSKSKHVIHAQDIQTFVWLLLRTPAPRARMPAFMELPAKSWRLFILVKKKEKTITFSTIEEKISASKQRIFHQCQNQWSFFLLEQCTKNYCFRSNNKKRNFWSEAKTSFQNLLWSQEMVDVVLASKIIKHSRQILNIIWRVFTPSQPNPL